MQVISFIRDLIHPKTIQIEFTARFQIPSFQILGLAAVEIQEARERIMAAFLSSGFDFPKKKIVVNLAPSSLKKTGTGHDLAIAIKILESTLDLHWPARILAWGELGLSGKIKPAHQVASLLEIILKEEAASTEPLTVLLSVEDETVLQQVIAWRKAHQLSVPTQSRIFSLKDLASLAELFKDETYQTLIQTHLSHPAILATSEKPPQTLLPLSPLLLRSIEIAITGRHHALILGPKGIGKSKSLEWIQALSPPSPPEQTWTRVLNSESIFAELNESFFKIPSRRIHAQVRPAHLLGSFRGNHIRAGELALSHGGLLFADEFMEWPRDSKECLREPLEQKRVQLARAQGQIQFECDFQLIGTGNLCPCGGFPSSFFHLISRELLLKTKQQLPKCQCKNIMVEDYFSKLSGPIADRLDLVLIHADLPEPRARFDENQFYQIKEKIHQAQLLARSCFGSLTGELSVAWLEKNYPQTPSFLSLISQTKSLRSRHKVMRIARTIQVLESASVLKEEHVFEALQLRMN